MQGVFYILTFFYTEEFTNEGQVNMMLYTVAQYVKLDSGFGPPPLWQA
jgi:hypothetical protein